jgi:hypothetical protein
VAVKLINLFMAPMLFQLSEKIRVIPVQEQALVPIPELEPHPGTGTGTGTDPGTGTGTGTDPGTGTGTGAGSGENTGDGLPIGATNTIQLQVTANGPIKIIKNNISAISLFGLMSINGIESQSSIIQIGYIGDGTGTFDLAAFGTESLTLDQMSPAKIKITEYNFNTTTNKGTIKGTFSADLTDGNGTTYKHAIGSFNISQ